MPDASSLQSSFLGGEWSPLVQGRAEDPRYRTALNVCRNSIPVEEGSITRRPGIKMISATRGNRPAVLRSFHFSQSHPYTIELTAGHIRYFTGGGIVVESAGQQIVSAVSSGNPATITTSAAHGWSVGDQLLFVLDPSETSGTTTPNVSLAPLVGRELMITSVPSSTTFTIADAVTSTTIDGSTITLGTSAVTVLRIADSATTFQTSELQSVNVVQGQTSTLGNFLVLLHNRHKPSAITSTSAEALGALAAFNYATSTFTDGPYLDVLTDGSLVTPSAASGSVTLTLTQGTSVPTFVSTDIGRMIRVFSEPANWAVGTTYASGAQVKYNGAYYQSLVAGNVGHTPDTDVINWAVSTSAAVWMWGTISAVADTTHCTVTLQPITINGITGPAALPRTTACTFRLGVFSDTTGYPTCGVYHEGRLWLAGAQPNRFDASVSNDPFNMTPTAYDGTVADNNGISGVFNASTANPIFWMVPDALGIIAGTQAGEWLIAASSTNDPLTPTSLQAHERTNYGSANAQAYRTGLTLSFIGRHNTKLYEYVTTDFRGLAAKNLSETAKHIRNGAGIAEIAYVKEKSPIIWARSDDGVLSGCTYRRQGAYASDPPDFAAWHHHNLGLGLKVYSIAAGPNYDGTLDALNLVLTDGTNYWTCILTDYFDIDWTIGDAMFVDLAVSPRMWQVIAGSPSIIRLHGLWRMVGRSVDIFLAGIDCGTQTVSASGTLDIPIDSNTIPLLTSGYLASLTTANNFHGLGMGFLKTPAVAAVPSFPGFLSFTGTPLIQSTAVEFAVDWNASAAYLPGYSGAGATGTRRISRVDLATGLTTLVMDVTNAQEAGGTPVVDGSGYLYIPGNDGAGSPRIWKFDPVTLTATGAFFGTGGGGASTGSVTLSAFWSMCTVTAGGVNCLVKSSNIVNEIATLNLDTMSHLGVNYTLTEGGNASVCAGRSTDKDGEVFIARATSTTIGLYRLTITPKGLFPTSLYKVASIPVASINGSWSTFDTSSTVVFFDGSDGNPCLSISEATPSVSQVLVKVNRNTGAVMWVSNPVFMPVYQPSIKGGMLVGVDASTSPHHIVSINLTNGAITTQVVCHNWGRFSSQYYNDQTGALVLKAIWSSPPCTPTLLGSTPSSGTAIPGVLLPTTYPTPALLTAASSWTVPAAIGFTYPTQGQILRLIAPQEAGAANGPALAKTRRTHMIGAILQQAQGISFGTDFNHLHGGAFTSPGGTPYTATQLYSGVYWDTLEDDYSFDGMVCWQITRPYPATILAVERFTHTQDR